MQPIPLIGPLKKHLFPPRNYGTSIIAHFALNCEPLYLQRQVD